MTLPTAAWAKAEDKPLSPRARALLIAIRQALYIIADALGDYAGLEKRVRA